MAKKPDNKNKENLDLYKKFIENQTNDIGADAKTPPPNLHPMDILAKEGQDMITADEEKAIKDTVKVNPVVETQSTNPYIRAKTYVMSKMDEWQKNKINRINSDLLKGITINPADQRMFEDFSWKITLIGNDLADGLPLPKK